MVGGLVGGLVGGGLVEWLGWVAWWGGWGGVVGVGWGAPTCGAVGMSSYSRLGCHEGTVSTECWNVVWFKAYMVAQFKVKHDKPPLVS